MNQMAKTLFYLVLGFGAFFWLIKAPLLSFYLSREMNAHIVIHWVSIWPSELTARGFTIQKGEEEPSSILLKAKYLRADYSSQAWLENPIVVDELILDDVTVDFGEYAPFLEKDVGRGVLLKKCILRNVKGVGEEQEIERIELDEISGAHGFPLNALLKKIQSLKKRA